jgi:ABC-type Fe3+/spermidine/putrescine transport system ATPase subunit
MIRIENLQVELGSFKLENINLEVAEKEYFILLGPTAAGKTVLLESIAGLNPIKKGRIFVDDQEITGLSPEKRGVSLVYQDHALFPHLTVKNNIIYGLKLRKTPEAETKSVLDWLTELLGIGYLLERRPLTLSGGERQKVALARALSIKPKILLLDEPLSALDPQTREYVQRELKSIHSSFQSTIIHVTHDFEEAMSLGTRIGVIGEGRIQQTGTPEEIFRYPKSRFVANFTLTGNIFAGRAVKEGPNYRFKSEGMDLEIAGNSGIEGDCRAAIRPEDVLILKPDIPPGAKNTFQGRITGITDKGAMLAVTVRTTRDIQCLITRRQYHEMALFVGDSASVFLDPASIHLFKE